MPARIFNDPQMPEAGWTYRKAPRARQDESQTPDGGMAMKTLKVLLDQEIECAYCAKMNRILVTKETIVPASPAETELHVKVERAGTQVKL